MTEQVQVIKGKTVQADRGQVEVVLAEYSKGKDAERSWKAYAEAQRLILLGIAQDAEMVVDANGGKLFRAPAVDRRNLSVDDAVDAVKRALAADPSLAAIVAAAVERAVSVSTSRRIYK